MKPPALSFLGLAAVMAALLAGVRGDAARLRAAPAPDPETRARNTETFDAMWTIVRDSHWDPAAVGPAWDAVRDEFRPKAESAADADALRTVLGEALARLGQSHFSIIPGELSSAAPDAPSLQEGRSGVMLSFMPASAPGTFDAVAVAVEPGSAGESAGLEPGMRIVSIDGRTPGARLPTGDGLERYERAVVAQAVASGDPGETRAWLVEDTDGRTRELRVTYSPDERPRAKFGTLPALPTELTWRHLDETERERWGAGEHEIGLVSFNIWLIPVMKPFDRAMDTLRSADGIVIDLRGNPGGIGAMSMGIAGHFTARPEQLGEMRTRDTRLSFVTNPRRTDSEGRPVEPYAGPLAILVDERSASTTEIFAGGLQHLGRARIFGTRTAGAALPAAMTPLPNGDVFLHAFADYRLPDGTALEASGVRLDNDRPYARADYAREGDPALAEAVRWIAAQQRAPRHPAHDDHPDRERHPDPQDHP
ncbi:MAG: S41 family peptidase [Phycisphaerales bacterium]